jgi:hypothetical protein
VPRFLMERRLPPGWDDAQLHEAAALSQRVREDQFPDISWEHSHVVCADDGWKAYCIYEAADADRVRAHAEAAGLPADAVYELHTDLLPGRG